MALNRAPFNALVDDDGSGNVGTPWEKARIAGVILDPVDVELAPDSCSVTAITVQTSCNPSQWNALKYDTINWQTAAGMFVPPNDYVTIPKLGYYLILGSVTFPQGDGIRGLAIYTNGIAAAGLPGQQQLRVATTATYTVINVSALVYLGENSYVQLAAFQNTGAPILVGGLHPQTTNHMQVIRVK
jgi:hypothetical protein